MIATINNIEFNVARGKGKGTLLDLTNEGGKKSKQYIFNNAPFHNTVAQLTPGMVVDLKMVKNGEYWNVDGLTIVSNSNPDKKDYKPSAASAAPAKSGGFGTRYADSEDYVKHKDASINRQSSIKAAVELVSVMLTNGTFKKTATADFIMGQVFKIAKSINHYTTLQDVEEALDSSMEDLESFGSDDGDDGFPG